MNVLDFFTDPTNWTGSNGIPARTAIHLLYTAVALGVAAVIALPIGILIGYSGRGEVVVAGLANSLRALPTLGLLILVLILVAPLFRSQLAFVIPSVVVLIVLAIPPILVGAYTGIDSASRDAVAAARGMGYSRAQILRHVQLPCAVPLIISGIRGATLQIVSTATVAAYVSLNGLGRYIVDGNATRNYGEMTGGAILVAALAIALELLFVGLARVVVSPGLQRTVIRPPKAVPA